MDNKGNTHRDSGENSRYTPFLEKLKTEKEIFSVPEDYFETSLDSIFHKIQVEEELNDLSPQLAKLGKDQPFNRQELYFQSFPNKVGELIDEQEKNSSKKRINVIRKVRPLFRKHATLIAACISILVSVSLIIYSTQLGKKDKTTIKGSISFEQLEELDAEELFAAVNWEEYDLQLISQVLKDTEWEDELLLSEDLVGNILLEEAVELMDWSAEDWYEISE